MLAELRLAARSARARRVAGCLKGALRPLRARRLFRPLRPARSRGGRLGCRHGARPPARTAVRARGRSRAPGRGRDRAGGARRARRAAARRSRGGCSTSAARSARTSTSMSTVSSRGRTRPSATPTGSTSSRRSREDEMTELLVGTKKGLFVLDGDAGTRVRGDGARVRRAVGRVRDARPSLGPVSGVGHLLVLRRPDLDDRRPGGRVAGGRGHGSTGGRRRLAGPDLGDRRRRGRRARSTPVATRAACSRATTAAARGRSTADCGISPRARTGAPAAVGSACTRSSPGPASPTG